MKTLINNDFRFRKFPIGTAEDDILSAAGKGAGFAPVDIPHDFLIGQVSDLYETCIGSYVRTLFYDGKAAHVFLEFDGVYMDSRFYINGTLVHTWPYGYSQTVFEITPYLVAGDNTLVVTCRYESPNTRWYSGAGIYRNCYRIDHGAAYLKEGGVYAVATPACESDGGLGIFPGESLLSVDADVVSDAYERALLRCTLRDAEGNPVASSEAFLSPEGTSPRFCKSAEKQGEISFSTQVLTVKDARAWDIASPYLYELTTELLVPADELTREFRLADSRTECIGFRSVRLDPDRGFFLNGRHVKLHGACMHHDLGALGAAVNKIATKRQLLSLLSMGVNAVRTSHNPPSVEFMDLCDELGILVDSEAFDMWELHKTDHDYATFFADHWKEDVASWIRRDRNRPSVVFWSIGNEIYDTHTANGLRITRELRDYVRTLDYRHHAYITIGSNYVAWEGAQRCADLLEASGYNYLERIYDEHHTRYPHWNIYGSETSSTVQSRGVYHFPADVRLLTFPDGQCSSLSNCSTNWGAKDPTTVILGDRDKEYSLGQFIWTGWDYIGEPTPYHSKNSFFGQCDTAGFPKDSYYIYQAGWTDPARHPMVHIVPYWDFNDGQMIDVQVFSNCPEIELFAQWDDAESSDRTSLGKCTLDHAHGNSLHGSWRLPYKKGTLTAVAYDIDGRIAATDTQRSFGDPAKIVLSPDKTTLTADGEDMIFIEVSTLDTNGTFVANARNRMNVTVTGAARLVGMDNGDSTDYEEYKGISRRLFSGRLLLLLAAKKTPGPIDVTVESPGLPGATLSLQAVSPEGSVPEGVCASGEVVPRITDEAILSEIPARKISLRVVSGAPCNDGVYTLSPGCKTALIEATVLPVDATLTDITFRALTKDGIDSAAVTLTLQEDGHSVLLTALGDEPDYMLYAFANNNKTVEDVISSLTFTNIGLGKATVDPYTFVSAIRADDSSAPVKLSFDGGVFSADEPSWVHFTHVDFGDYGSDRITIPIFSFSDTVPIEIWEGIPGPSGTLLFRGNYEAKSWYNHYQPNTFRLAKRLRGVTSISILVPFRLSLHGFVFQRIDKAWAEIGVAELLHASGDAYNITEDGIYGISNNVDLAFGTFDFGERGARTITVTGRSHAPQCTIHLHFTKDGAAETQIIDIPKTDDVEAFTFSLDPVHGACTVNFIFLPGTDFDLLSFRFE